jgi:hypothetical protein
LYFVANTANLPKLVRAHFRDVARGVEAWDPYSGKVTGIAMTGLDRGSIDLDLSPYESILLFFSDHAIAPVPERESHESVVADLSREWQVSFAETEGSPKLSSAMDQLVSWTSNPQTEFYSGRASYRKSFQLEQTAAPGDRLFLDFGAGKPEPLPSPPGEHNMRAYLEPPIREVAQVFVNDQLAGVIWHPPYTVDITALAHAGSNELRIEVGNTAINELAGKALPDYRLLWDRYSKRFEPQDMQNLRPLASGLLGPITLIEKSRKDLPGMNQAWKGRRPAN